MSEKIDNAEYVDARGCAGLTKLEAPNAKTVEARGCAGLTLKLIIAPVAREAEDFLLEKLIPLLRAGGKFDEAMKPEHWQCHEWTNCPMAACFGVNSEDQVPAKWRADAKQFVRLFDLGLISRPILPGEIPASATERKSS
jgi:hypothetical protein